MRRIVALFVLPLIAGLALVGCGSSKPASPNASVTAKGSFGSSPKVTIPKEKAGTTLAAGGRVTVRQVSIDRNWRLIPPHIWGNRSDWYDPDHYRATFMVVDDARPGAWTAEWWSAVRTFGRPARTLHPDGCTVLVWHRNLLAAIR